MESQLVKIQLVSHGTRCCQQRSLRQPFFAYGNLGRGYNDLKKIALARKRTRSHARAHMYAHIFRYTEIIKGIVLFVKVYT